MQLLHWSTELELGLEPIDNQHKQLITIINELNLAVEYNQPNSSMIPIIDKLIEYAHSHFHVEEEIFTTYGYPDRSAHEAEHATFLDSLKYIRWQCGIIEDSISAKTRVFLLSWLCNHIRNRDLEYKRFIDRSAHK